jgi:MinD-like ATPase involved in chromosome partitioning or flagellar assembly
MEPENDPHTMTTVRTEQKGNGRPQHQKEPEARPIPGHPGWEVEEETGRFYPRGRQQGSAVNKPSTNEGAGGSAGPMRAQIREAELVTPYRPRPTMGWRKALYRRTRINLGPSPKERGWNDLERRIKTNLRGTYLIAVMGQKGGVSKTVTTVGIGAALAHYRTDKVAAIDANPAHGNMAERIDEPTQGSWWHLINDRKLNAYSDFRYHLGKDSTSGLEVLASDPGDRVLTGVELTETWLRLQRQFPVSLVDCGNQLNDDITAAILELADAVIVVSTTGLDGAQGAKDTLNWLLAHNYPHLVRAAVVVVSNIANVKASHAVQTLHEDFERAVRAVHAIPYDPHLHEAAAIRTDRLKPATRRAFVEAAASVADGFAAASDKEGQKL